MTKFRVFLSRTAEKELNDTPKQVRERIKASLKELEADPFKPRARCDIKKLHKMSDHEFYRLRIGDYRAMYAIVQKDVKVTKIIPRGKGYEWLE